MRQSTTHPFFFSNVNSLKNLGVFYQNKGTLTVIRLGQESSIITLNKNVQIVVVDKRFTTMVNLGTQTILKLL